THPRRPPPPAATALRYRVHVNAHEQVAVGLAESSAVGEGDQGIARAGKGRANPAAQELGPQEARDREGDVLLGERAGEVAARIARIRAAVSRIDYHAVMEPEPGQRASRWGGNRAGGAHRLGADGRRVPTIAAPH